MNQLFWDLRLSIIANINRFRYCDQHLLHDDTRCTHMCVYNVQITRVCDWTCFIVNTSGVPRLTKFYTPLRSESQPLISKIFSLISSRPASLCNFLDAPELQALLGDRIGDEVRVVYRCYATLYFVFVVDTSESELGILDLIQVHIYNALWFALSDVLISLQVFVESLDRAFENVCELDLVFHFDDVRLTLTNVNAVWCLTSEWIQVHHILGEVIQGGLVLETNVEEIGEASECLIIRCPVAGLHHYPMTPFSLLKESIWATLLQREVRAL